MKDQIEDAADSAKRGNIRSTGHILGAGAKVTKDQIYSVVAEAYGGMGALLQRGITGVPAVIRDYVIGQYEAGVRRCQFLLENR